ncbi:MAG TPA: Ig-like domain-containing protein [Candidatus Saccharimonadales bacterium]
MPSRIKGHLKYYRKKFKRLELQSHHGLFLIGTMLLIIVIIGYSVNYLNGRRRSFADIPSTPTLSDVCGVTNSADIGVPATPVLAPTTAINKVIVPASKIDMANFRLVNISGTEEAYILTDNNASRSISVYNLLTRGLIATFPVAISSNSADSFALDPQGNVYVIDAVNTQYLYKYSPTGTVMWKVATPGGSGGAYGYTNSTGTFLVAFQPPGSTFGGPVYSQTGTSSVYDVNGAKQADNNMDINVENVEQDPTTGDITAIGGSMFRVYKNDGTLKFQMGTDLSPGGKGPWHFYIPNGAVENPSGGYFISDTGNGMESFDANGGYQGIAPDFQSQNGANNTIGVNPGHAAIYNGNVYYILNGGINAFDSNNNSQGIYSISLANLTADINYPQGSNGHLGIGGGLSTPATNNYFSPTTSPSAPSANLTFYPWWAKQAANFTVQYSVKSIPQIEANASVTPTSISLGSVLPVNASAPITVPLNLGANTAPGAYEISAHIYNNSAPTVAIGADCLDYSVGATGNIYIPSTINSASGANVQAVEVAHELGQNYVRGVDPHLLDSCLPGYSDSNGNAIKTVDSSTTISCPASELTDLKNAQALANQYGIAFTNEFADGQGLDKTVVSSGQWGRLVGAIAAQLPTVTTWLLWNEVNNTYNGSGSTVFTNIFQPAHTSIKAANPNAKVIAGSTLGVSNSFWQQVGASLGNTGFKYMDGIDMHPYPDYNKSMEEQGIVIPPLNATPSEAANLGTLDQLAKTVSNTTTYQFNSGVSKLPITDSEYGIWNSGPVSYYNQGNKLTRGTILQNSIGITGISNFQNNSCVTVSLGVWGTIGCGYDGGDAPAALAETTMQHMLFGSTVASSRKFVQWLPTGVPHTYAAQYGPSATDSGSVVVVWADDYDTSLLPSLSGGGTISVTSQYGAGSSLSPGSVLPINGQVQYLSVPSGHTLSISPSETYGANLSLDVNGATATASSTAACSPLSPAMAIRGIDDLSVDNRCGSAAFWAQAPGDANPTFTVTLKNAQTVDRVFLSSTEIDSASDGLRSFDVQVSATVGGAFTTVGSVTNAYFERNHLISIPSQTVAQIRIANMTTDYSGYGNGLPPTWWPTDSASLADPTNPWYGQDDIMDIETYATGTSTTNLTPPTVSITSPTISSSNHGSVNVTATASDSSGSITKVDLYVDGSPAMTDSSSPYSFSWNTLPLLDGAHSLSAIVYSSDGLSTTSAPISLYVTNGDLNGQRTVNYIDSGILSYNYGKSGSFTYAQGDVNGDTTVNYIDSGLLSKNYGKSW